MQQVATNQVVNLLDKEEILQGLIYVSLVKNLTIVSQVGTQIAMLPNSSDAAGPYIRFDDCNLLKLINISLGPLSVKQSPLILTHTNVILENFKCVNSFIEATSTSPLGHTGACILARNGQMRISRGHFESNVLSSRFTGIETCGGAIALSGGTMYIFDSYFNENEVNSDESFGGAICADKSSVHVTNTTFLNNQANGISAALGGAIYVTHGDLDMSNCVFINNSVTARDPSAYAAGGAVYHVAKPAFPVIASFYASVADCIFHSNNLAGLSDLEGGAIIIQARSALVRNSSFTANFVGMLLSFGPTLTSRGSLAAHGGALKVIAHAISVSDCYFGKNKVSAPSGYAPGWAFGGAAELITEQSSYTKSSTSTSIRVLRNSFYCNLAMGGFSVEDNTGGSAYGGALRIIGFEATITVFNNSFNLNTAIGGEGPSSGGIAAGAALSVNHLASDRILQPIIIPDVPPLPNRPAPEEPIPPNWPPQTSDEQHYGSTASYTTPPKFLQQNVNDDTITTTTDALKAHWNESSGRFAEESLLRMSREQLRHERLQMDSLDSLRKYEAILKEETAKRLSRRPFDAEIDEEDWAIEAHFSRAATLLNRPNKKKFDTRKHNLPLQLPQELHKRVTLRQAHRAHRDSVLQHHLTKHAHISPSSTHPYASFKQAPSTSSSAQKVPIRNTSDLGIPVGWGKPSPFPPPGNYTVDVSNNTFKENAVVGGAGEMIGGDATGGAMYFEGSFVNIYGCTFFRNLALGGDTQVSPMGANTGGYGRGGAIYIHQHSGIVQITDSSFSQNEAAGGRGFKSQGQIPPLQYGRGGMAFGGAISVWTILPAGDTDSVHLELCFFQDNVASGGSSYLNAGEGVGGAVWGARFSSYKTAFISNRASNGGAIYAVEYRGRNTTFLWNDATAMTSNPALGGALSSFNASIENCNFRRNTATTLEISAESMGGAIHSEFLLSVSDTTFSENSALAFATTARGGAIAALNRTEVVNSSFISNIATALDHGTAFGLGGAIYMEVDDEGSSYIKDTLIYDCVASFGGGIYSHGINAAEREWIGLRIIGNRAYDAGGGIALLPYLWTGGILTSSSSKVTNIGSGTLGSSTHGRDTFNVSDPPHRGLVPPRNITGPMPPRRSEVCQQCNISGNFAAGYGPDLIMPYMSIIGNTSNSVNPGLPFYANFKVLDWAENTVKARGVTMSISPEKDLLFQSGSWQNMVQMNMRTGVASFSEMTAWGDPKQSFRLNFTLGNFSSDFGSTSNIALHITYTFDPCPAGYRIDSTSAFTSCQHCLAGTYGFDSTCDMCPHEMYCAYTDDHNSSLYLIGTGFQPSPHTDPVVVLPCPYRIGTLGDADLASSCLPTICETDCGPSRILNGSTRSNAGIWFSTPYVDPLRGPPNKKCHVECSANNCAPGHTGFLCTKCVCDEASCYYPSDQQCHKCQHSWKPTVIVFSIAVFLFVILRGTLLAICLGILSTVVIGLTFANRISTLLSSLFGTAFIIFIEAQRGSSSGLIKSFVFFMQTVTVFITPDVLPRQMLKLASMKSVTQFHVVGLECLSPTLFGNPFQQFLFAMFLPFVLMLMLYIAFWVSELLRLFPPIRMLQDFDPLDHISFFRDRFRARQRSDATYSLLHTTMQHSESEISLSGSDPGYLSGDLINESHSDTASLISSTSSQIARQEGMRAFVVHTNWKIGRVALFLIFAAHFELCNRVLEVFAPCVNVPSEKFSYSSTLPWLVCQNADFGFFSPKAVHGRMAIAGLIFGVVYILGVPAVFAGLLFWKRQEIKAGDTSTTQSLGLLYNSYRPSLHYFELVWLFRRVLFSAAISILPPTFISHLIAPTVILVVSLLIQRRYKPFILKEDNNMEVISLLAIMFTLSINIAIGAKPSATDTTVWKWINILVVLAVMAIFVYRLFKPVLNFLRTPREE